MLLTKFTHSCVRLEKYGVRLVIDPGVFSESEQALEQARYVLITHEHPDHYDTAALSAALDSNLEVEIYAPSSVLKKIAKDCTVSQDRLHSVDADAQLSVGPFNVKTFGGQHALIHPLIPTIDNVGFLIDDTVFHPGDSFTVPHGLTAPVVLVPLHAPWSKMSEVIDFIIATRATTAYQIHDALLSQNGFGVVEKQVSAFAAKYGTTYQHLDPMESVAL